MEKTFSNKIRLKAEGLFEETEVRVHSECTTEMKTKDMLEVSRV